jgi:glycerol 3-phosphatase-2
VSKRRVLLCDLDGVVWRRAVPIPGSVDALNDLVSAGWEVFFITNSSHDPADHHADRLEALGVPARERIVNSPMAAALLCEPGERVLCSAGPGVRLELERRGCEVVPGDIDDPRRIDVVVVGLHPEFDYRRLGIAMRAVRSGARFIGTNSDPTFPTEAELLPGGGAILAAVATASGVSPVIAGKPEAPMAKLILVRLAGTPERLVMVGDRASTDGRMAAAVGAEFAHVLTGVDDDAPSGAASHVDLRSVVNWLLDREQADRGD